VTNVSGRHLAVEHQMEACATGDEVIVSERETQVTRPDDHPDTEQDSDLSVSVCISV
jgi:hypothetical protein